MTIPRAMRRHELYAFAREIWTRVSNDRVPLAAAAISFYMTLSMVPLLLLAVSLAAFFIDPEVARRTIIALTTDISPDLSAVLQREVLRVVENRGLLTGIALLLGAWSGSQVFIVLETTINQVWYARRRRSFWLRRAFALLMMIIVGLLVLASIMLTNIIRFLVRLQVPVLGRPADDIPWLLTALLSYALPMVLISALFLILYRLLPTRRVTVRAVIPGAVFAGVLWTISLHVFGWYVADIANFSILYGSLGGLILLMLWFYYSAWIMLLGAEISAANHRRLLRAGDVEERQVEEE